VQLDVDFGRYAPVYERARPFLDARDNDVHVRVSFGFARRLLAAYPDADEEVVLPAIILHDIGWKLIPEEEYAGAFGPRITRPDVRRRHEIEGARIASMILAELEGYASVRTEIVAIIDGHDTRTAALSLNDELVKDADKLWRFSVSGTTIDSRRFGIPWSEHVAWLARRADEWMFTDVGVALAHETLERTIRDVGGTSRGRESR